MLLIYMRRVQFEVVRKKVRMGDSTKHKTVVTLRRCAQTKATITLAGTLKGMLFRKKICVTRRFLNTRRYLTPAYAAVRRFLPFVKA